MFSLRKRDNYSTRTTGKAGTGTAASLLSTIPNYESMRQATGFGGNGPIDDLKRKNLHNEGHHVGADAFVRPAKARRTGPDEGVRGYVMPFMVQVSRNTNCNPEDNLLL
jgi:hypothetical protein